MFNHNNNKKVSKESKKDKYFFLKLAAGILILIILFSQIKLDEVVSSLKDVSMKFLFLCFILASVDRILMGIKWNLLLRSRKIVLSFWDTIKMYFIGNLIGSFTPGGIGIDAYRFATLLPMKENKIIISSIIIERLIGFAAIAFFAIFGLRYIAADLGPNLKYLQILIYGGFLGVLILFFLTLMPGTIEKISKLFSLFGMAKIIKKLEGFHEVYAEYRDHKKALITFTILTGIEILVLITVNYFAARSLLIQLSYVYLLGVIPLYMIIIRLPITVYGIGLQEGFFAFLLLNAGYSAEIGISMSVVLRVIQIISQFLPAIFFIILSPIKIEPNAIDYSSNE